MTTISETLQMQKVLDHGYVKYIDSMGTDETVIEAARMSTGRGFERWNRGIVCKKCRRPDAKDYFACTPDGSKCEPIEVPGDAKLLEYLYSNHHMTPFEMGQLHVEVCAPIFVWRQWHRHRTFSYNEQSARYAPLPDLFYVPSEERIAGSFKASTNKQASGSGWRDEELTPARLTVVRGAITREQQIDREDYEHRLALGMAPELARLNVPVSQYSRCRVNTDLRNWLAFFALRQEAHAQWEIRQYADACAQIVKAIWPRSYALFKEYTLDGVQFSASEIAALREWVASARDYVSVGPGDGIEDKAKRNAFLKKLGLP